MVTKDQPFQAGLFFEAFRAEVFYEILFYSYHKPGSDRRIGGL